MLPLFNLTMLAAAFLLGSSPLPAETTLPLLSGVPGSPTTIAPNVVDINGGVLGLYVDNSFTSMGASAGVLTTFHGATIPPSGSPTGAFGFRIFGGEVDLAHGIGDATSVGNMQMSNGITVVTLRHLEFDNSGMTPVVSAEVLVNGMIAGRYPVFTLDPGGAYPFQSTPTSFNMGPVPMFVSDVFVSYINTIFGKTVFKLGTAAGTAGLSATLGTIP